MAALAMIRRAAAGLCACVKPGTSFLRLRILVRSAEAAADCDGIETALLDRRWAVTFSLSSRHRQKSPQIHELSEEFSS
jgi:hypothetical protein